VTTSTDSGSASDYSSSGQPSTGSDGQQVWNPSVGVYAGGVSKKKRESYGGIIAALQDNAARSGLQMHSYPENFGGIIAAIQDLQEGQYRPGSDVGEQPPGGDIIINPITGLPEWIESNQTVEGQLWFDTRQGRLFVYAEKAWHQTNGGDGLAIITDTLAVPPDGDSLIPGTFWWVRNDNNLYIFDGYYVMPNGHITEDPNVGGDPVWKLVADPNDGAFQTTLTLPLGSIGPKVTALENLTYLPEVDLSLGTMTVQKDYNEWVFQSLVALDLGLAHLQPVIVDIDPPEFPAVGQLWYDTESLELSIWYEDDNSGQWVPTSVSYKYDDDLAILRRDLTTETRVREQALHSLHQQLEQITAVDAQEVAELQSSITGLQAQITAIPEVDLEPYATDVDLSVVRNALEARLNALESGPDLTVLMGRSEIEAELDAIKLEQQDLATADALNEVEASIPDVSSFVSQNDIDASIAGITVEYLPRTGGTLTGSFVVEKVDYSKPGFDFSTASWHSKEAFKLLAQGTGAVPTTFGTTNAPWELAWEFAGHEDFCWSHADNGKQLSVSKDGVACKNLLIGDFTTNNDQGRIVLNTIDVKDRLQRYQSAFEHLRQGVHEATDFDTLKANIISALANV